MTWDAIILIIVGWGVVHFFSRQRDLKKDARSFALQTANHVTKIEEKAIAYHVASTRSEPAITLILVKPPRAGKQIITIKYY